MKENELYKKSIEMDGLEKETIRAASITGGSGKGTGRTNGSSWWAPSWSKGLAASFLLIICIVSVAVLSQNIPSSKGMYANPSDYGDLYRLLSEIRQNTGGSQQYDGIGKATDDVLSGKSAENFGQETGSPDYSDTNLQVAGVQEADVVKTDGKYIYALSSEKLYIVGVKDGKMKMAARLSTATKEKGNTAYAFELYVSGNKLIVLKRTPSVYALDDVKMVDGASGAPMEMVQRDVKVTAIVYDISNRHKPKMINELSQRGDYVSSRMVDHYLYLATSVYVYPDYMERTDVGTYVPTTSSDKGIDVPVAPDDIYITPNPQTTSYVTLSGIDVDSPGDFVSTKAILGNASNIYASMDNLYITNYDSVTEGGYYKDKTDIIKFAIKDGHIAKKGTGSVYGTLLNQFSMDENDGLFRIVTTVNRYKITKDKDTISISNNQKGVSTLTVLDEHLKKIGKVSDLGRGQQVYSVRFDGKIGYVVTYKQVDPLYAIDLSDPSKPKVLSALKIPGFSDYMQPYGEGLLFGIGKETTTAGTIVALKLSMFDVSDKKDVREIAKYVLDKDYNWSEASWNHKAILVSPKRNLIAFPSYDSYFIFSYTNGEFNKLKQVKVEQSYWGYGIGTMRGMFIGDYFYIVTDRHLQSMDMKRFHRVSLLRFQ